MRRSFLCIVGALWTLALTGGAHAQGASPWSDDLHSSVRLIAGKDATSAGVEIKLKPGWKTYWRYPGDAGLPPEFSFAQSGNAEVEVLWPAPHRFTDEGGDSIGYKDRVIFPLRIKQAEPGKPVTLRLHLRYGVCERLCVPAEGKAELTLDTPPSAEDQRALDAAEARVPERMKLGEPGALGIKSARRVPGAKPGVVVEATAPPGETIDLFAEGPKPDWALPLPKPEATASGTTRFAFALDGLPPGGDPNAKGIVLKLTLVSPLRAIEVETPLD